jgi:hypothetical protein
MKAYMAAVEPDYEFDTFFWGALIFLAVFVLGFALWKAFEWLRSRIESHRGAAPTQLETPKDSWDQAISRPAGDRIHDSLIGEGDMGGLAGMNQREQEIFFSTYAPRKVRKEMKQRLRAREEKERGG